MPRGLSFFFMGRSGWCINVVHLTVEDPFTKTIFFHRCVALHKCPLGETDFYFSFNRNSTFSSYQTRRLNDLSLPRFHTNCGKQRFTYQAAKEWNSLEEELKSITSLSLFKAKLKTFLDDF